MPLKRLGTALEIHEDFERRPGKIRYALLDFDGTISLLRAGWQQVMVDQFVEVLISTTDTGESKSEFTDVCQLFITRLTGRQTIYQMLQLEEEVIKRGGQPLPAAVYKKDYLEGLGRRIATRIKSVKRMQVKRQQPVDHMIPGTLDLLAGLKRAGVNCYLASGTDLEFVLQEAELLGVSDYFRDADGRLHIYGALDDYKNFSKKIIIERILRENRLAGEELVVLGDGYVELENARDVDALAVGVASLESGGAGWDHWKKERLREVGAHILVPDWQECDLLLDCLGIH